MCILFHHHFDKFNHYLRFEKRYAANTLTAYSTDLKQFQEYLESYYPKIELSAINHFQVRSWLADLKENNQTEKTINRKRSSISGYYKFLMRNGIISKNPCSLVHSLKTPERLPTFLKESETELLFEELSFGEGFRPSTDRLILEILYSCGLRRIELVNIAERDIEWSLMQIRIWGKGNKERLIPLGLAIIDHLKDYLALKAKLGFTSEKLFCLENGKPIYEKYVYLTVKNYLKKVTTLHKKSPHIMRHTFATHLLNNGANIQAIKELLGHSSIAATQVYTHINIDELKKVHKLNHPRG